jgi:membrane-associated PAP2 superfamily phosphatase
LGLALLVLLAWDAMRPLWPGPGRRERAFWWAVMAFSALAVPALKRASLSSCPWDLAAFGGVAAHVPHWLWGVADGGPGRCFPSGHAVSAFALLGLAWLWRPHRPRLAQALGATVLLLGLVYALAQVARGAHFVSHGLWSAWLCAALAVAASALAPACGAVPSRS